MTERPWTETEPEGRHAEDELVRIFVAADCWVRHGRHGSKWDIEVRPADRAYKLEIKNEDRFAGRPNLCIELWQGKEDRQPSGIALSRADVVVHKFGERAILYYTQDMRTFLKAKRYPLKSFEHSSNGNEGVLVPKKDLVDETWCDETAWAALPAHPFFREQPVRREAK